jgi:hypothetical protein
MAGEAEKNEKSQSNPITSRQLSKGDGQGARDQPWTGAGLKTEAKRQRKNDEAGKDCDERIAGRDEKRRANRVASPGR